METRGIATLIRDPTAWAPIALSLSALAFVMAYVVAVGGIGAEAPHDEGTPARLFQLLMLIQGVIVLVFAVRWLPRAPRPAAIIIAVQVMAALLPILTVLALESGAD